MTRTIVSLLALAPLSAVALLGCKRDTETTTDTTRTTEPEVTQAAGARVDMDRNAREIQELTSARCARERRCDNFGAGKKYADEQDCLAKLKAEKYDDLKGDDCRGGINQDELQECLTEIRNDDCNQPLDTLGRIAACRSSDLCKAAATTP